MFMYPERFPVSACYIIAFAQTIYCIFFCLIFFFTDLQIVNFMLLKYVLPECLDRKAADRNSRPVYMPQ